MFKQQSYDISASFLVPAYNLPNGVLSDYLTTQRGENYHGKISIDVWLVKANKENPQQSMIASLQTEEANFQAELEKALAEEPENQIRKSEKVLKLEHGRNVFSKLVQESKNSVFHKTPDAEFMRIAEKNLRYGALTKYEPDLNHYLYLAGLSRYEER